MTFNINEILSEGLINGGARPSLFKITISDWPGSSADSERRLSVLATASQIPPSIHGVVEVPYFGRKVKVLGDRVYANWNVVIMCDEDYGLRRDFETWHQSMNQHVENLMTGGVTPRPNSYKRDALITQYSKDGSIIANYTIKGMFPLQVDAMRLGWADTDQIMQFEVEFTYDYFLPYADSGTDETTQFGEGSRSINIEF
jgi:hypothetical protein